MISMRIKLNPIIMHIDNKDESSMIEVKNDLLNQC